MQIILKLNATMAVVERKDKPMTKPEKMTDMVSSELLEWSHSYGFHIEEYEDCNFHAEYGMNFSEWLTCYSSYKDAEKVFDNMTDEHWEMFIGYLEHEVERAKNILSSAKGE